MWKIRWAFVTLVTITTSVVLARPANENQLDKATKSDVILNLVSPKSEDRSREEPKVSITSSGTSGINSSPDEPSRIPLEPFSPPAPSPPRPGMFAKFIDDVFQIPITVLQSVTKLLTNPFRPKDSH